MTAAPIVIALPSPLVTATPRRCSTRSASPSRPGTAQSSGTEAAPSPLLRSCCDRQHRKPSQRSNTPVRHRHRDWRPTVCGTSRDCANLGRRFADRALQERDCGGILAVPPILRFDDRHGGCARMSKIFLGHSSANNAAALAMAQWLRNSGWMTFSRRVPARGLTPGALAGGLKAAADAARRSSSSSRPPGAIRAGVSPVPAGEATRQGGFWRAHRARTTRTFRPR